MCLDEIYASLINAQMLETDPDYKSDVDGSAVLPPGTVVRVVGDFGPVVRVRVESGESKGFEGETLAHCQKP